jgi:hypothetical protein
MPSLGHRFRPIPSITSNSNFPSVDQVCGQVRQNQITRYMGTSRVVPLRGVSQAERTPFLCHQLHVDFDVWLLPLAEYSQGTGRET